MINEWMSEQNRRNNMKLILQVVIGYISMTDKISLKNIKKKENWNTNTDAAKTLTFYEIRFSYFNRFYYLYIFFYFLYFYEKR